MVDATGELRNCRGLLGTRRVLSTPLQCGAKSARFNLPAQIIVLCHVHTPSKFFKMFTLFLSNLITCLDCSKASVNLNFINHTLFLEQENEGPIKLRDLIVT